MAEYYFTGTANGDGAGRVVIPKPFADKLKADNGHRCEVCVGVFEARLLQADHRIPFAIAGDQPPLVQGDFMPLCAPDNRAKSWSCEQCPNLLNRDPSVCARCFGANPRDYDHVEMRAERRLTLVFQGQETVHYDESAMQAAMDGTTLSE